MEPWKWWFLAKENCLGRYHFRVSVWNFRRVVYQIPFWQESMWIHPIVFLHPGYNPSEPLIKTWNDNTFETETSGCHCALWHKVWPPEMFGWPLPFPKWSDMQVALHWRSSYAESKMSATIKGEVKGWVSWKSRGFGLEIHWFIEVPTSALGCSWTHSNLHLRSSFFFAKGSDVCSFKKVGRKLNLVIYLLHVKQISASL